MSMHEEEGIPVTLFADAHPGNETREISAIAGLDISAVKVYVSSPSGSSSVITVTSVPLLSIRIEIDEGLNEIVVARTTGDSTRESVIIPIVMATGRISFMYDS